MNAIQVEHEPTSEDSAKATFQKLPLKELGKRTFSEFKDDEVTEMAAGVAYHAIFAIPPMIIFIVTLAALVGQITSVDVAGMLRDSINERAPADTRELLTGLVDSAIADVSGGVASFGVIISAAVALWSGSNGISTFIRAFNRAYDVDEDRPFIKKKAVSIGLTILMGVLIILAFVLFVFGQQIGSWGAGQLGLGSAFEIAWNILRWPLAVAFIVFLLAVLYYLGPNVEQTFHWISPGSIVATLLWIAVVFGFKIYVTFSNPGSAYGAVGGVVVLLFFLYLTAIVFLIGAEVNAVLQRRYDEKTIKDLAHHPDKVANREEREYNAQNARDLDRREGTMVARQSSSNPSSGSNNSADPNDSKQVRSTRPGKEKPKKKSKSSKDNQLYKSGFGNRIGRMIGSTILSFASSKFGKKDQEKSRRAN